MYTLCKWENIKGWYVTLDEAIEHFKNLICKHSDYGQIYRGFF